jgi:hypothetical protein
MISYRLNAVIPGSSEYSVRYQNEERLFLGLMLLKKRRLIFILSSEDLQSNVFDTETAKEMGSDAGNHFSPLLSVNSVKNEPQRLR